MKQVIWGLVWLCLAGPVMAEKRIALLIGNDAYSDVPVLEKAVADAEAMAEALSDVGFETVLGVNLGRRAFNLKIAEFTAQLEPGDTAFVFYAGHGVEIAGENYLLPVDIPAVGDISVDFVTAESIALSRMLDRIRRTGARTTLAVLDACRDNPFPQRNGRSIGRGAGLGRIAAPEGTFVMFSAGVGQLALDKLNADDTARNSVFTRSLLPKISEPGLELRRLIADLRVEVRDLARTQNHAQFPAYYDELLGEFYFTKAAATARRSPGTLPDLPVLGDMGAVPTAKSVRQAMDDLEAAVAGAGAEVFARIDHGAEAASVDLNLAEAELLIFGNPRLGTPAMQDNILTGLFLPLRVLVFDHQGQTVIAYEHPAEMLDDFDVSASGYVARMEAALEMLVQEAAK